MEFGATGASAQCPCQFLVLKLIWKLCASCLNTPDISPAPTDARQLEFGDSAASFFAEIIDMEELSSLAHHVSHNTWAIIGLQAAPVANKICDDMVANQVGNNKLIQWLLYLI